MEKKKWIKHIPLFILEFVVLVAAALVLYITLKATDKEGGAVKDNLQRENIAVNEEVKVKVEETEETGPDSVYTGVVNVAFLEWTPVTEVWEKETEVTPLWSALLI